MPWLGPGCARAAVGGCACRGRAHAWMEDRCTCHRAAVAHQHTMLASLSMLLRPASTDPGAIASNRHGQLIHGFKFAYSAGGGAFKSLLGTKDQTLDLELRSSSNAITQRL